MPINPDVSYMTRWTQWAKGNEDPNITDDPKSDNNLIKEFPYEKTQDPFYQLNDVNNYVNMIPYEKDGDQWKRPSDFMANGGECASYALTKYYNLKKLGWSPNDMRVVVLQADVGTHAVLAVDHGGKTLILDNMVPDIKPDTEVQGYTPIYSISDAGWQLYTPPAVEAQASGSIAEN